MGEFAKRGFNQIEAADKKIITSVVVL